MTVRLARQGWLISILRLAGQLDESQLEFALLANEKGIRWADATRKIPLETASVEVVYSSHMLEHLDREGAEGFLREVRRVLLPGGIVRVAVPDLRQLAGRYLQDGDADRFMEDSLLSVPARRGLAARLRRAVLGDRHHLWMYDGESLKKKLNSAGFIDAAIMPPGATVIRDPGPLNLRERAQESVYVEAVAHE